MVREDLIEGAITFLQDPSVASAPIDQRIAFLRSKNLTQEEIDVSLSRVGQSPAPAQPISYAQQRPPQQQYGSYPQQQYWAQPPPEPPRRDWRDYFIVATVMGGLGYGLYWTAKRYVAPLIAPPTPPQLEQDKAGIDASFDKAFALLDQLASDTAELKAAEKFRTERLDAALQDVENVVSKLKEANESREVESKRIAREVAEIRELVPKAIEKEREGTDGRLRDLGTEMKSLKTLVANRMAGGAPRATPPFGSTKPNIPNGSSAAVIESEVPESAAAEEPPKQTASVLPERSNSSSPYGRFAPGGKTAPAIPAWQLAAKKRNEDAKKADASSVVGTQESGTATPVTEGEVEAGA
ncbi:peroxisomal membrane protein pex14 [Oleoguttula sp. CCFEE 5521]